MEINLDSMRKRINELDKMLVTLFEERMQTVSKVAIYKKHHHMKVLDPVREKEVIARAVSYLEDESLEMYLRFFMDDMMTISRQYQIHQMQNTTDFIGEQSIRESDVDNGKANSEKDVDSEQSNSKIDDDSGQSKDKNNFTSGPSNNKNDFISGYSDKESENAIKPEPIIGHYGPPGSYTEEAALEHFGEDCPTKAYMTFDEVVAALLKGDIDIGVLPVENSSTGTITAVMDLIRDSKVYITGEHISPICHHLLAIPGTSLHDIRTVYSHHQGLEQSSQFLKKYPWEQVAYKSTASSAELVRELGDKTKAAIASQRCAKMVGLEILVPNIQYNKNNYTRFIIIGRKPVVNQSCNKISIIMDIAHKPGALYSILRLFNERNVNLLKIESRPIIGKPWEYLFFFDFEGNLSDERVKMLLECLKDSAHAFRFLGNYMAYEKVSC